MTNPDRDELVKLLVWGKSRITGEVGVMAQDAYTSIGHYIASDNGWFLQGQSGWNASASMDAAKAAAQADYEARIRSALVEVPAVKGEPEPVASERISQLAADLVVSGWTAGDHGIELAKSRAERKLLEFACDEIERHMRSHTAPPADAGMREALGKVCIYRVEGDDTIHLLIDGEKIGAFGQHTSKAIALLRFEASLREACMEAALTAPGATTKSDGGEVVTAEQMDAIEKAAIAGQPLTNYSEYTPVTVRGSTSDPLSTRSEVTALTKRLDQVLKVMRGARNRSEPMAIWADDIKAVEDARALLDQFEIRRK